MYGMKRPIVTLMAILCVACGSSVEGGQSSDASSSSGAGGSEGVGGGIGGHGGELESPEACPGGDRLYGGACCTPAVCGPGMCGPQPDGCGLIIECDFECGDGLWMYCGSDRRCVCTSALDSEGGEKAERECVTSNRGHAMTCGSMSDDAPRNCTKTSHVVGPSATPAWCCI
jgi:hypothetical protein